VTTDAPGPIAGEIAGLWWVLLALGAAVYLLVLALLAGPILRRRRGGPDPGRRAGVPAAQATRWILAGGVVLPAVVLSAALAASVETMHDVPEVDGDALVVDVVAHQFWWSVSYPAAGVSTANEVHIPVGVPVEVRLTSDDVIHSFWVPDLAGKMDALPDGTNTLVLLADEAGVHDGRCAEFCGLQHARMDLVVVAEPRGEFTAWLEMQASSASEPTTGATRRGADVFAASDCGRCHTISGTEADGTDGPDLTHVASRRALAAGTVPNTTDQLRRWLRDPDAVKEGVDMPAAELSDEDLDALVAYLESLE
jgi:cytochrome c oxidase subunit 2